MFDKLVKKKNEMAAPTAPAKSKPTDSVSDAEWQQRLQAAAGDDDALLSIARTAVALTIKQAAIEAMTTEAGLRAAEREFRSHDRRIYREAKLRYEGKVVERIAREEADNLIAQAQALLASEPMPANRYVDIDRAWGRLDLARLSPEAVAQYRQLADQLTTTLRARGDQQLSFKRWQDDVARSRQELIDGCFAVAQSGMDRDKLAAAYDRVESLRGQGALLPHVPTLNAHAEAEKNDSQQREIDHHQAQLEAALQLARALDARLNFLDGLISNADTTHDDGGINARWQALPVVNDPRVASTLNERFDAYRRAEQASRAALNAKSRSEGNEVVKRQKDELRAALEVMLTTAETALAEGHIVDSTASLAAIDTKIKGAAAMPALNARIERLRGEIARLKGWQHWGGGRVREDLVDEASTLAKAITNEKLNLKTHAAEIDKLRERWKELDKLGGATSRELWTKFDAALKTAHLPVDAQLAKLKAQRQENLAARNILVTALAAESAPILATVPVDWRLATRALDHFQTEWRKLGPPEHTVPHKAQAALMERMRAATMLLETPLTEARRVEALKREQLVERAKAIAADANGRDTITKVRALQAEWQTHAKALPLSRQQENKLWAAFKSATDEVFKARDAASRARDQAAKSAVEGREALITQLQALDENTPTAEVRKVLNEVDAAWRKAAEMPRPLAAKIEAKFRAARDHARDLVSGSAKRSWSKVCDGLEGKIALCAAIESGTAHDVAEEWAKLALLPAVWETPLAARRDRTHTAIETSKSNALLLKLESALEIASPAQFQAERRELKLLAMKQAIEARQAVTISNSDLQNWIAQVIAQPLDESGPGRLRAIINAIRSRPLP
jgi:DNA repair protein SbcC/Rad50